MNKSIQNEWVEALESGSYEQTTGALHKGKNSYCCMGVLCSLYMKHNKGKAIWADKVGYSQFAETDYYGNVVKRHNTQVLPEPVRIWAGLLGQDPQFQVQEDEPRHSAPRLSTLNDTVKALFPVIAHRIKYGTEV